MSDARRRPEAGDNPRRSWLSKQPPPWLAAGCAVLMLAAFGAVVGACLGLVSGPFDRSATGPEAALWRAAVGALAGALLLLVVGVRTAVSYARRTKGPGGGRAESAPRPDGEPPTAPAGPR